jgi:SSS family transporter
VLAQVTIPFGPGAYAFIAVYLTSLIAIGWLGRRARKSKSMADFYLAGRSMGLPVLLLTLYATQYSGNTMLGFTGKTYRIGYAWTMSIHFMTAVVVSYLIYAPRLYAVSQNKDFITPTDYLAHRFNSTGINLLAAALMIFALANYTLAQLVAMGRAFQGLAGQHTTTVFVIGVVLLALIMGIYETLGGMRSVAWTDVIQGGILMLGFAALIFMVFNRYGSLGDVTRHMMDPQNNLTDKVAVPDAARCREWGSYVLLIGLGGSLYPHAIQRIYAARSEKILRRSLMCMAFMPLTSSLVAVLVGVMAIVHVPGLQGAETDSVLTVMCRNLMETPVGYVFVVLLFSAMLAALMSTADSALLSISSMVTKDVYAAHLNPNASQESLTRLGKIVSWIMLGILVMLAIALRESTTLVQLMDRKLDMLVQLVPAIMIGLQWRGLRTQPVFIGMIVGTLVTAVCTVLGETKPWDFHIGIIALVLNLAIALIGSLYLNARTPTPSS